MNSKNEAIAVKNGVRIPVFDDLTGKYPKSPFWGVSNRQFPTPLKRGLFLTIDTPLLTGYSRMSPADGVRGSCLTHETTQCPDCKQPPRAVVRR